MWGHLVVKGTYIASDRLELVAVRCCRDYSTLGILAAISEDMISKTLSYSVVSLLCAHSENYYVCIIYFGNVLYIYVI